MQNEVVRTGRCALKVSLDKPAWNKTPKMKVISLMAEGTKGKNSNFVYKNDGVSINLNEGKTFVYKIDIE